MPARVHEQWTVLEHFPTRTARILQHSELHSRPTEIFEHHSKRNPGVNQKSEQIMRIYTQLNQHVSQNVPKQRPQMLQNITKDQPQIYPTSTNNRSKIDPSGIPRATLCKRHQILRSQVGFIAKSASKRDRQNTPKSSQVDMNASPRAS